MRYLFRCAILTLLTPLVATEGGSGSPLTALKDTAVAVKGMPRTTWQHLESYSSLPLPYLQLPVFQHARLPLLEKEHFSPAAGAGYEKLSGRPNVRAVIFPASSSTPKPPTTVQSRGVFTWCTSNKMHVQVHKSILGVGDSPSHLKLGTCDASTSTKEFVYFEYDLGLCGDQQTMINDQLAYTNTLRYDPLRLAGPIRRAAPFTLSVTCHYNRYHYSYKIGYMPKTKMHAIIKTTKDMIKFTLTPLNAQWERLSSSDRYEVGKPMYFQAEATCMPKDGRLFVHSCHATVKKSLSSMPQFTVVDNFGCAVESAEGRSRFIPYKKNIVRLSVDTSLFKGVASQQLYMHCAMSVGGHIPSPTAKACNYDTETKRWLELFGSASVCSCCDSRCTSTAPPATTTTITTKMMT